MLHFDESFIVAICFLIFVFLAYRPIKKAIVNSLDARIGEIKETMNNAQKLRDDAKIILEQLKMEMEHLESRKQEIIDSAEASTSHLIETKSKEIDLQVHRMRDSAIKSIDSLKNNASKELQEEFTEHVMDLVQHYLKESNNNQVSNEEIMKLFLQK